MIELNENDLITLEGIVSNERNWDLLKEIFKGQIAVFWECLRTTDISNDARVLANHKLAVGVEAALGAMVQEIEDTVRNRRYKESDTPIVIDDQTKTLYQ